MTEPMKFHLAFHILKATSFFHPPWNMFHTNDMMKAGPDIILQLDNFHHFMMLCYEDIFVKMGCFNYEGIFCFIVLVFWSLFHFILRKNGEERNFPFRKMIIFLFSTAFLNMQKNTIHCLWMHANISVIKPYLPINSIKLQESYVLDWFPAAKP